MTFGSPMWLWGLAALPLLALALWLYERTLRRRWERFAKPSTGARIRLARPHRSLLRNLLMLAATACVLLALARPLWGTVEEPIKARGLDLIVALDLSRSMLAEDLAPSRLTVARSVASAIAQELPSDRVGLVGFAGDAASLCPLTLDRGALELYLDSADPSLFSAQGTDLGAAIDTAREMFARHGSSRRVLVILSDGEDQEERLDAAFTAANAEEITIYTVGVGGTTGAPIPERDRRGRVRGYHEDREGQRVSSRLIETSLMRVAERTGGAYARATGFGQGATQIAEAIERLDREDMADVLPTRQAERYRWPLTAAVLLAACELGLVRRRRESLR